KFWRSSVPLGPEVAETSTFWNGLKGCTVTDMAAECVKVVAETLMVPPDAKTVGVKVMLPDLVMTGVKPAAERGPVIVMVLPDEVAEKPALVMTAATLLATL